MSESKRQLAIAALTLALVRDHQLDAEYAEVQAIRRAPDSPDQSAVAAVAADIAARADPRWKKSVSGPNYYDRLRAALAKEREQREAPRGPSARERLGMSPRKGR